MNPDWLPTLNMGNSKERSENEAQAAKVRWERAKQREVQRNLVENVASSSDSSAEIGTAEVSTQLNLLHKYWIIYTVTKNRFKNWKLEC